MASSSSSSQSEPQNERILWNLLNERDDKRWMPDSQVLKEFFSRTEAKKNRDKNQFGDIAPYDRNRVLVGGQYLNASWVRELYGGRWWIATQAPMKNTEHTLLSLFLQDDVRPPRGLEESDSLGPMKCRIFTIIQLARASYIPSEQGEQRIIAALEGSNEHDLKMTLKSRKDRSDDNGYIESVVKLVRCDRRNSEVEIGEPTYFRHFRFTIWPDMGVPEEKKQGLLTRLIQRVEKVNREIPVPRGYHPDPPIILHCLAGVGRTGTLIALSSLLRYYGLLPSNGSHVRPPALVRPPMPPLPADAASDKVMCEMDSLRDQRNGMIQRRIQLNLARTLLERAMANKASQQEGSKSGHSNRSRRSGKKSRGDKPE